MVGLAYFFFRGVASMNAWHAVHALLSVEKT